MRLGSVYPRAPSSVWNTWQVIKELHESGSRIECVLWWKSLCHRGKPVHFSRDPPASVWCWKTSCTYGGGVEGGHSRGRASRSLRHWSALARDLLVVLAIEEKKINCSEKEAFSIGCNGSSTDNGSIWRRIRIIDITGLTGFMRRR